MLRSMSIRLFFKSPNNININNNNNSSNQNNYSSLNFKEKEDLDQEYYPQTIVPPTRRLISLLSLLSFTTILITFIFFITLLTNPRSLPRFSLRWIAKIKGQDVQIFTTGKEFCGPLVEAEKLRKYTNSMKGLIFKKVSGTTWLPREDWAYVITGEELMSRGEYSPDRHGGKEDGMIKLIHQSWKTHIVHERFRDWSDSWRALHPGWEQVIWSDADNLALVQDFYPDRLPLFLSLPTLIHKADFARNLYMHKYGGVYSDLDVMALLPTSITLNLTSTPTSSTTSRAYIARMGEDPTFPQSLPNAYFASTSPGHPFWLLPMEFAQQALMKKEERGPEWITGPVGVWDSERVWKELEENGSVGQGTGVELIVLDQNVIFPFAWSTSWHEPADLGRCLCWGSSRSFDRKACRSLYPEAGALTFWTKSWAGMVKGAKKV